MVKTDTSTTAEIEELLKKPTIRPAELQRILRESRGATYEAIKRGDVEYVRFGKNIHVLTAPLRRKLGMG